jgi:hypothetical protein
MQIKGFDCHGAIDRARHLPSARSGDRPDSSGPAARSREELYQGGTWGSPRRWMPGPFEWVPSSTAEGRGKTAADEGPGRMAAGSSLTK